MDTTNQLPGSECPGWVIEPVKKSISQRMEELEAYADIKARKSLFKQDDSPSRLTWYLASAVLIGVTALGILLAQPLGCVQTLIQDAGSYQAQMACRMSLNVQQGFVSSPDGIALNRLASLSLTSGTPLGGPTDG